jgi:exopolysaccharide biosynthesis polyprenyl glycosylphosphotransferase
VFRGHHRKAKLFFGLSDVLITALAFESAYYTRVHLRFEHVFFLTPPVHVLLFGWSVLVWVAIGYGGGIYERLKAASPHVIIRDTTHQCLLGIVSLVLLQYALGLEWPLSRPFVVLFCAYGWLALCLLRLNAPRLARAFRREFGTPRYVMVAGTNESALRFARELERSESEGVQIIGFLADSPDSAEHHVQLSRQYEVYPIAALPDVLRRHIIDEIIFAVDSRRLAELEEVFLLCDEEGVRTRVVVDFFPHINSRVYLDSFGDRPLLTFSATPHDEIQLLIKRATDVAVAGAALAVVWPVMALIALLVRMTSPGPAIFRQVRCGLNGRRFICYKFRSMHQNAEELKSQIQHLSRREIATKIPGDPRLTRLGRYLRKFSVDEWPQFWNILKGDMSLVGPRPPVPEEVEQYKPWQRRRLRMRPGLTCLWAVSGRDSLDFETWMKLDMQYIDNWSLGSDWRIILRTIPHVLSGRGAH